MALRPIAAALAVACAALPAAAFPFQLCLVMLLEPAPRADALQAARAQIAAQGCEAGDPLVVVGSAFEPRAMAAALCRRGAGVQISEMRDSAGPQAQVDCELPHAPRPPGGRR